MNTAITKKTPKKQQQQTNMASQTGMQFYHKSVNCEIEKNKSKNKYH